MCLFPTNHYQKTLGDVGVVIEEYPDYTVDQAMEDYAEDLAMANAEDLFLAGKPWEIFKALEEVSKIQDKPPEFSILGRTGVPAELDSGTICALLAIFWNNKIECDIKKVWLSGSRAVALSSKLKAVK